LQARDRLHRRARESRRFRMREKNVFECFVIVGIGRAVQYLHTSEKQ
jgi:hypothetical protein